MPAEYATAALLANHLYHGSLGGEYLGEEQDHCEGQRCAQSVQSSRRNRVDVVKIAVTQAHEHEAEGRHVKHVPSVADIFPRVFPNLSELSQDCPLIRRCSVYSRGEEWGGRATGNVCEAVWPAKRISRDAGDILIFRTTFHTGVSDERKIRFLHVLSLCASIRSLWHGHTRELYALRLLAAIEYSPKSGKEMRILASIPAVFFMAFSHGTLNAIQMNCMGFRMPIVNGTRYGFYLTCHTNL